LPVLVEFLNVLLALLPVIIAILVVLYGFYWVIKSDREANEKAEKVVISVLSPTEYQQLHQLGYVDIASPSYPGRYYRVPAGQGMVSVMESGRCIERLCAQPTTPIPDREIVLIHKLMIEGNEQEYLQTANHFPCL
jgi:hypothetical protein